MPATSRQRPATAGKRPTGQKMDGVLFVVMPFGAIDSPQAGVSTMQAQLKADGVPCDIAYLNLTFAAGIGLDRYSLVSLTSGDIFAGEWLFATDLFSNAQINYRGYIENVLMPSKAFPAEAIQQIVDLAPLVGPFLDHCMATVPWDRYSLIGFTSMFDQNLSSLALARRIKDRYPDKLIAMGGANCAGPMGVQLHKSFPFLDFVFTGEADLTFPALVRRLASGQPPGDDIKGYVRRRGVVSVDSGPGPCLMDLDQLPYPNFDDFYRQYDDSGLPRSALQYILLETGRGCWWGEKNQCNFCGINHNEIPFRAKSAGRALDELNHVYRRYGIRHLMPTDNIIGLQYFKTLLPELRRRKLPYSLFYESKANVTKAQVKLMREAGVISIQPGIEAFSENVLELMHKGVSPLQNVQLLKWCRELGVQPMWNLLYGFPGENAADYRTTLEFVRAITRLEPPMGFGTVRLERFSPMFDHLEQFGIRHVAPLKAYRYIYGFDEAILNHIAYFFDFDYDGKEKRERWFAPLAPELERWRSAPGQLRVTYRSADQLVVGDTRPTRICPEYRFGKPQKTLIEFCDDPRHFADILKHLQNLPAAGTLPEPPADEAWLKGFLDYLVAHRLMVRTGDRYLSVIVSGPNNEALPSGCVAGG